jgi:hypothetical protein
MDAAAHLPKLDFDPNKPYESRIAATAQAGDKSPAPNRNRRAPVAALLGGLTRKP